MSVLTSPVISVLRIILQQLGNHIKHGSALDQKLP